MTKVYCWLCDKVLTVSKFSYEEIVKYIGVSESKLSLTYNFVLPKSNYIPMRPDDLNDVHGKSVDIDKPFFFYVGNLQPGKNIKGMIDGFLEFVQGRSDVQLIIAGKPTTYGDEMVKYVDGKDCIHYIDTNHEIMLIGCWLIVKLWYCFRFVKVLEFPH